MDLPDAAAGPMIASSEASGIRLYDTYLEKAPRCDKKLALTNFFVAQFYTSVDWRLFITYLDKSIKTRKQCPTFINNPLAGIQSPEFWLYPLIKTAVCFNQLCTAGISPLKRCTRCKYAGYCSVSCQKQDLASHKSTCKQIAKV